MAKQAQAHDPGKLVVSSSPHVRAPATTKTIMYDVLGALIPAIAAAFVFFGSEALVVIALCTLTCMGTEWAFQKLSGRPTTISDGSAAVTGVLLALTLPSTVPWWIPVVGGFVAIGIAKQLFGGLGYNIFNPALIARVFLLISWPVHLTGYRWPSPAAAEWVPGVDTLTSATPLAALRFDGLVTPIQALFTGNVAGSLGETSALALLIGASYLLLRGRIDFRIPLSFIGTVVVLGAVAGQDPLFHLLSGGLLLGALFMATDYVTTPITPRGRIVFGVGCGLLTVGIRLFGGYPEGVAYSILLMNAAAPLIERATMPRIYGEVKTRA